MNIWERLQTFDRRYIYVLLFICIGFPIVRPLGLPVSIGMPTQNFYDTIERLSPGDTVIMSLEVNVSTAPDVFPQATAVFSHLMSKGIKVIIVTFGPQGALFTQEMCDFGETLGGIYGEDFVSMGFVPGLETGLAGFVNNIKQTTPVDIKGTRADDLPILQGINNVGDVAAYIGFSDGVPGPFEYVRQIQAYDVPILTGVVTVMGPQTEPYIQAGQVQGLLTGLRGAAEYELVMQRPGTAVAGMDAQSAGHLLIILFIILGNLAHLMMKKTPDGGGVAK